MIETLMQVNYHYCQRCGRTHSAQECEFCAIRDGAITAFVLRVKERAENNMQATGTVSGAHWNAMRQVLAEMGIEVTL